ncbi:ABC transporter ATP-binding protein [Gammaproteobacteria bacterium]|nr:ABC transporter ATP-binding protein [Gammaproteobacteria bacterium]
MLKDLKFLFDKKEKLQIFLLLAGSIVMAFLEVIGVASILPFMNMVLKPDAILENSSTKLVYDYFSFTDTNIFLVYFGFLVLFLLALSNFFSALMYWAITFFSKMQGHRLGMKLLNNYLKNPYEFFLDRNTSDLGKNILSEVDRVVKGVVLQALQAISKLILTIVVLALLFYVNPYIASSTILILGGAYLIFYLSTKKYLKKIGHLQSIATFLRFRTVDEAMLGIKEVKLHSLEEDFIERFENPSIDNAKYSASGLVIAILPRYVIETFAFGGIIGIVIFMLSKSLEGSEIIPILSLYALAGYRLLPAIQNVYSAQSMIKYNISPFTTILEDVKKLQLEENIKSSKEITNKNINFEKNIKLKNIFFSFNSSKKIILKKISLEIGKNSSVAFVGPTGSGKTTLIDCILGLLVPDEGEILIDGKRLEKNNIESWQAKIGYVPQYIFLIDDSIKSNIAFGLQENKIDPIKLKKSIKMASLEDYINSLEDGLDTIVGENGVRLSGGQRQRIGIARALYNSPEVLVFDEATSSLDGTTEKFVMNSLSSISGKITSIIIAHRLSTVKDCDSIFFLDGGEIADYGSFEDLHERNEKFRSMSKT